MQRHHRTATRRGQASRQRVARATRNLAKPRQSARMGKQGETDQAMGYRSTRDLRTNAVRPPHRQSKNKSRLKHRLKINRHRTTSQTRRRLATSPHATLHITRIREGHRTRPECSKIALFDDQSRTLPSTGRNVRGQRKTTKGGQLLWPPCSRKGVLDGTRAQPRPRHEGASKPAIETRKRVWPARASEASRQILPPSPTPAERDDEHQTMAREAATHSSH